MLTHTQMSDVLKDPSAVYQKPEDVLSDENLNVAQKKEILNCWEEDLKSLVRAESENMAAPSEESTAAEKLSCVSDYLRELEQNA